MSYHFLNCWYLQIFELHALVTVDGQYQLTNIFFFLLMVSM